MFQEKDVIWLEIPKELSSKKGSDRMMQRRKALFFYRSMYLLWHEASGGGILMISVHKPDAFFVYLSLLRTYSGELALQEKVLGGNTFQPWGTCLKSCGDRNWYHLLDAKERIQKLKTRDIRWVSKCADPSHMTEVLDWTEVTGWDLPCLAMHSCVAMKPCSVLSLPLKM